MSTEEKDVFARMKEAENAAMQYENSIRKEGKTLPKVSKEDRDLLAILDTPHGRRFIYSILDMAGTYGLTFVQESERQSAFNEGARWVGLQLLRRVETINLPAYFKMLNEHKSDILAEKERKKMEDNANGQIL